MLTQSYTVRRTSLLLLRAAYLCGGGDWDEKRAQRETAVRDLGGRVLQELHIDGIQACLVEVRGLVALVLPGSNERADWKVNFTALPFPFNGRLYHHGWLRSAVDLIDQLPGTIHLVTGHSYGAAVAQLVGAFLCKPTLAWASPKPLWKSPEPYGFRFVQNVIAADDGIRHVPSSLLGYRWIGNVEWLHPGRVRPGEAHRIAHYLEFFPEEEP